MNILDYNLDMIDNRIVIGTLHSLPLMIKYLNYYVDITHNKTHIWSTLLVNYTWTISNIESINETQFYATLYLRKRDNEYICYCLRDAGDIIYFNNWWSKFSEELYNLLFSHNLLSHTSRL